MKQKNNEKPILFNSEMVKAILEGRKTQTRRVVKAGSWENLVSEVMRVNNKWVWETIEYSLTTPFGKVGDRLWVREKHKVKGLCSGCYEYACDCGHFEVTYAADNKSKIMGEWDCDSDFPKTEYWRPSIFLPRFLSRITLEITNIRVERLQDISEEDIYAEGIKKVEWALSHGPHDEFKDLWQSINGAESWNANPWVWVVEFKKI